MAVFQFSNTYLSLIRDAISAQAADARASSVDIVDGQNAQPTQNEQIDLFITKGLPAMAVNQVDRELANVTLDKAKAADIPVVFFNKEPLPEVLDAGTRPTTSAPRPRSPGIMQGQLVIDYWNAHPEADKNGDGIIQYVMLQGPADHQDAQIRTVSRSRPSTTPASRPRSSRREIGDWSRPVALEQMGAIYAAARRRHRVRARQQRQHGHRGHRGAQGERLLR